MLAVWKQSVKRRKPERLEHVVRVNIDQDFHTGLAGGFPEGLEGLQKILAPLSLHQNP
jgi:hypothetical protein